MAVAARQIRVVAYGVGAEAPFRGSRVYVSFVTFFSTIYLPVVYSTDSSNSFSECRLLTFQPYTQTTKQKC